MFLMAVNDFDYFVNFSMLSDSLSLNDLSPTIFGYGA